MIKWFIGAFYCLLVLATVSGRVLAEGGTEAGLQMPELKIYDASGRPWRRAREDWNAAQQKIKNDPAWRKWFLKEKSEIDSWMAGPKDRVEWVAGWSHDGVSLKDGSLLRWTNEIPGEDVKFLSSRSDSRVGVTEKNFRWWVVTFRGKNADMVANASRLYRLTGDARYAEWAKEQIDFYADHFDEWQVGKEGGRLFGHTVTEASNLIKYSEAIRLLDSYVTRESKDSWWRKLFEPETKALNDSFQRIHNIACWQRSAVAQIALVFGQEDIWREAIGGPFGIKQQVSEGITSDFLWQEQSFGYNEFAFRALLSLFMTASFYDRLGDLVNELAPVENMMLAPLYLRFPDGSLPNPADTIGLRKGMNFRLFAEAYRVYPSTPGYRAAAKLTNWDTLVDPVKEVPEAVKNPEVRSVNLPGMRMALLKSGSWQVFFHYGQLVNTHAQEEALNYSAFHGDTEVTRDTGTTKYGSELHGGYFKRALNHNVPLLNGEGQEAPEVGELLAFSSEPAAVSAAQPNYWKNGNATRTLEIKGDKLIVSTSIRSTTPEKLGLATHVQGKVSLPDNFVVDANFSEGRPKAFSYWRSVRKGPVANRITLNVLYGEKELKLTFSADQNFTIWHAVTPDSPPSTREGFYLETTGTGAIYTTVWEPIGK